MKDLAKGVPRWVRGVFVGKSEGSDEFIVLTPAGAHTFRTVRRLSGDQRHSVECLESTAGLPWNTKAGSSKAQPALVVSQPRVEFVPVVPKRSSRNSRTQVQNKEWERATHTDGKETQARNPNYERRRTWM